MRRILPTALFILFTFFATAGNHYISHIAEDGWTTTITAYNDGPTDRYVTLYRYDSDGVETVYADLLVPAQNALVLTNVDFGYLGTAMLETPEEESPLSVKLSYR